MHWEHLFEDLEGQLVSEWEADRAALDAESERLRIARTALADRLRALAGRGRQLRVGLASGETLTGTLRETGADWLALEGAGRLTIVPLAAVRTIGADLGVLVESLGGDAAGPGARARMTLGFVLRDLARRRMPVHLGVCGAGTLHGTVDRAGADHLDLALHEAGQPRRADEVRGFRIIPQDAVSWVSMDRGAYDTGEA